MKKTRVERFGSFIKEQNEYPFEGHRDVLSLKKDGKTYGHVTEKDGIYYTHGQLGEWNEYENIEELFKKGLTGFDINLDDIFWD